MSSNTNENIQVDGEPFTVMPLPNWLRFRSLKTASPLMPPPHDLVDILPPETRTAVRYDHDSPDAGYHPERNEIVLNKDFLGRSDVVLAAVFRHEKSHAVFSHLPQDVQVRLVELFLSNHHDQLGEFYQKMREYEKTYPHEYFNLIDAQRHLSWREGL